MHRPLHRTEVTAASKIMLPACAALFTIKGWDYAFSPRDQLLKSPALAYADDVMPIGAWGALFLADAALMVFALSLQTVGARWAFSYALWVGIVSWAGFAVVFALAARVDATRTAWALPAFVAVCCYASYRSISKGEV